MSSKSSIALTQLDFDSYKESIKTFLKSQDQYKDYDFENSNMSTMLDVLSYNTYLNGFYLNMVGNEMFLDTARIRDSVVSHAKDLNYLPRSFSSSIAKISLKIVALDPAKKSIVIPRGTTFLSRVGDDTFTFTTDDNIVTSSNDGIFVTEEFEIFEGSFMNEAYSVDYSNPVPSYRINNKMVDISSVGVTILEDNGSNRIEYRRATSLFDLDETSPVFFIQPVTGDNYEIIFGDGIIGRKPKNNSVALIEYRVCSGELPNGARNFIPGARIDNEANVTIHVVTPAAGGSVAETMESIKYNAPRSFTTQERAVTAEDYENLLKTNYPEINAATAYGGEDLIPPQFGKVFVSVDLKDIDGLPNFKKEEYTKFLRSRSSTAIEPIFTSPEYTYLRVISNVKYNINITAFNPEDIRTYVTSTILNYSKTKLDNFNRTLRYSRLVNEIDDTEDSIISNETKVDLIKLSPIKLNIPQNLVINFKTPLLAGTAKLGDEHFITDPKTISTSTFIFNGTPGCMIEDDGMGVLRIVAPVGNTYRKIIDVGEVDYEVGILKINNFKISKYDGPEFKVYATPKHYDIVSAQNTIINILEPDISVNIEQIRE